MRGGGGASDAPKPSESSPPARVPVPPPNHNLSHQASTLISLFSNSPSTCSSCSRAMDLARDIISRGRCSVPTCPCEAFVRLDLPSVYLAIVSTSTALTSVSERQVPNTPCICTHNGYQHVRGGGEEALLSVQCGGFLAATVRNTRYYSPSH